jgi:hypothetical protein
MELLAADARPWVKYVGWQTTLTEPIATSLGSSARARNTVILATAGDERAVQIQNFLWYEMWYDPRKRPQEALTWVPVNSHSVPGRYGDGNRLYLVVDPSAAKRWVLRTVVQGIRRDIGLGGLRLVSLAEARIKAHDYRRLAREGGSPDRGETPGQSDRSDVR